MQTANKLDQIIFYGDAYPVFTKTYAIEMTGAAEFPQTTDLL